MGSQRPYHLLIRVPVFRHDHFEDESLPSRVEMRRLTSIAARNDCVVCADRDIDLLLEVPVEIPEDHIDRPVGVPLPALKGGGDILAPRVLHLAECARRRHDDQSQRQRPPCTSGMDCHGGLPLFRTVCAKIRSYEALCRKSLQSASWQMSGDVSVSCSRSCSRSCSCSCRSALRVASG